MFYQLPQTVTTHLGYFCKKLCPKNFQYLPNLATLVVTLDSIFLS